MTKISIKTIVSDLGKFAVFALIAAITLSASPAFADTPLYATCTAIPYNTIVGDYVNWQAQGVTGGNGAYTYTWSGTDGLTGSDQTIHKTYSYAGTKSATVTITSGGQVYTASCSTNVSPSGYNNGNYNNYPYNSGTLTASCYALPTSPNINDTVTWYGSATGGSGSYTYSWSGTDGLYGNTSVVSKSYPTNGVKTGFLTVYSNGQTVTQTCSTNVGSVYNGSNNSSYCQSGYYYNGYQCVYGGSTNYNNTYCPNGYYNGYQCVYNNSYNGFTGYNNYNGGFYTNPPINNQTYTYPTTYSYPTTYTYPATTYTSYGNAGTPVSGVFLSQVPSTGISFGLKMSLFVLGLFIWSLFAAHLISHRRKSLVTTNGSLVTATRIEQFKKDNLAKKALR